MILIEIKVLLTRLLEIGDFFFTNNPFHHLLRMTPGIEHTPRVLRSKRNGNTSNLKSNPNKTLSQNVVNTADKEFKSAESSNLNSVSSFLDLKDIENLSTDEKISLVVNRAIDVINSFNNLKLIVEKYEHKIDKLSKENATLSKENEIIKVRLTEIENSLSNQEQNCNENDGHVLKFNSMKQAMKNDECEFWGVDESQNEDLVSKIIDVAQKFNTTILPDDISFVSRRKSNIASKLNIPDVIRVKFYNRRIRDKLVKEGRLLRIPRSINIDQRQGRNFIYINEALTGHNEYLYGKTREMKRKKLISRTWCKNGKIFMQCDNKPPVLVEKVEDLNVFIK